MKRLLLACLLSVLITSCAWAANEKYTSLTENDELAVDDVLSCTDLSASASEKCLVRMLQGSNPVGTATSSGGTLTVDFENGTLQDHTLDEDTSAISFENVPANATTFVLFVTQDASTARTFTGLSSVSVNSTSRTIVWSGGIAPLTSSGLGDIDIYTFIVRNDLGTPIVYGMLGGQDFN
jgi:hypothetical protein